MRLGVQSLGSKEKYWPGADSAKAYVILSAMGPCCSTRVLYRPPIPQSLCLRDLPVNGDFVGPLLLLPQLVKERLPGHLLQLLLVPWHVRPGGRRGRGKGEPYLVAAGEALAVAAAATAARGAACRALPDVKRCSLVVGLAAKGHWPVGPKPSRRFLYFFCG